MPAHVRLSASRQLLWPLAIVALALSAQAAQAFAQDCAWRERGYGGGGRFTAVAMTAADPNLVLIGSDVAGYFKSTDGGHSYKPLGASLEGLAVAAIAINPQNPKQVLILTDEGLYESADGADTLTRISGKVRYNSRFFGSSLIVWLNDVWYAASDSDGVFKLSKGPNGAWTVHPMFGLEGKKVNALVVADKRLTVATDEGAFFHDGEIWKTLSEGLPSNHRNLVDMAAHPGGKLYAVEQRTGLYAFEPRLNRWDKRGPNPTSLPSQGNPPTFKSLAVTPDNPDTVYMATNPEGWPHLLLRTQDAGRNWTLVKRFTLAGEHDNWAKDLESVEQIAFSPDGRSAFLLDWWNVWHSADGGASWLQMHKGLQNTVVNHVLAHPTKPGVLFAAADDNGLMVSRDDGRTWRRKMNGVVEGHGAALALSAKNPDLVYLLVTPWKSQDTAQTKYFHLYKSLDGGETWKPYRISDKKKTYDKPFVDSKGTNLVIDPATDDAVYVTANGYGVYRVDTTQPTEGPNGDAKAQQAAQNLPLPFIKGSGAFIIHPTNPKIMLAAALDAGIFRTEDGGATWRLTGAPKTFVFGMAMDPADPMKVYAAAAEKRVLKSVDNGQNWQWVNLPGARPPHIAANSVAVSPGAPGLVVVGTAGYNHKAGDGVFISRDHGETFAPCPSGLPRAAVLSLSPLPGEPGAFLAGFNGTGVHQFGANAPAKDGR